MSVESNTIRLQAILDTVSKLPTVEDVVPDTIFLYVRGDTYPYMIYVPEKEASRIVTKADLAELMIGGRQVRIMLIGVNIVYAAISEYGFNESYGWVRMKLKEGSLKLYTAEYTPPTPMILHATADDEYLYHTSNNVDEADRVTLTELQEIEEQGTPITVEVCDGEQTEAYKDCWLHIGNAYGCVAWYKEATVETDTETSTGEETETDAETSTDKKGTWQYGYTAEYRIVTFYASADDEYVYHTSDTTDASGRVTLAELQEIANQALPITVEFCDGEQSVTQKCWKVSLEEAYGIVRTSTDSAEFAFYTAEYVYLTLYGTIVDETEDGYLYLSGDSTDEANRMTKAELLELKTRELPMLVRLTEKGKTMRAYANMVSPENGYGRVTVWINNAWRYLYTTGKTVCGWDE